MSRPFRFKQFEIQQKLAPFKVGTDGVSLGAWAGSTIDPNRILDIGTGTGLIGIMLAQRFQNAEIHAVEINPLAAQQARDNIDNCPWTDRIHLQHSPIQDCCFDHTFDLITCNPPYFKNSLRNANQHQAEARHGSSLELEELPQIAKPLLGVDGNLAMIIPADREMDLLNAARTAGLFPKRICRLFPTPKQSAKRLMIELQPTELECSTEDLLIEEARHAYSQAYKNLTRDFLLKH